jgi:hypothetical protein
MQTDDEFAEVGDLIMIKLRRNGAESISLGMADLLCWVRGFEAACPNDIDRHPMGAHQTREMREALLRALEQGKSK